jgi:hypothetical protein
MAGETNRLIELAVKLPKIMMFVSMTPDFNWGTGYNFLLAMVLNRMGYPARSFLGPQVQNHDGSGLHPGKNSGCGRSAFAR